jgi:hypothetical protein
MVIGFDDLTIQVEVAGNVWRSTDYRPVNPTDSTIDTNGSDFDTFLSIFTGSDLDVLNLVGTDDNSGADGEDSLLQVNARAGQTFEIAVDGSNCETGNIVHEPRRSDRTTHQR